MPAAGGDPVVVTKDAASNWNPVWSPDGRRLLYYNSGTSYIIDLDKGWREQTPQTLPPIPGPGGHFVVWDWSPAGKKVAGTYRPAGKRGIGYFSFETNRYEMVAEIDSQPMWLPDSRRLVFGFEGKALIADTATGRVREVFSRQPERIRSVDVSADGRLLYFTVVSSENDIWLLDLD